GMAVRGVVGHALGHHAFIRGHCRPVLTEDPLGGELLGRASIGANELLLRTGIVYHARIRSTGETPVTVQVHAAHLQGPETDVRRGTADVEAPSGFVGTVEVIQ